MKLIILAITLIAIIMTFILPHIDVIRQESRTKNKTSIYYKIKEKKEKVVFKNSDFEKVEIEKVKQTTLLHKIVLEGNVDDVKKVVENGTPINIQTKHGLTALHIAAILNKYDVIKYLINNNADPNIEDNNGDIAVDLIAQIPQNSEMINFLKTESANKKF